MSLNPFKPQISPYIIGIKDWKIANAIISYLRVTDNYSRIFEKFISSNEIMLDEMHRIEKQFVDVRQNLTTVFRQLVDPKTKQFEEAGKFTPNDGEMRFIINVELLFHTIVIVEEYKYSMEYYHAESNGFEEAHESLSTILVKIQGLFEEGRNLIKDLFEDYKDNVILLSWLLENRDNVALSFGESIETVLVEFFGSGM